MIKKLSFGACFMSEHVSEGGNFNKASISIEIVVLFEILTIIAHIFDQQ